MVLNQLNIKDPSYGMIDVKVYPRINDVRTLMSFKNIKKTLLSIYNNNVMI